MDEVHETETELKTSFVAAEDEGGATAASRVPQHGRACR